MKKTIVRILPLWGIECRQLTQICSSVWEINNSYVIKVYSNKSQLQRNVKLLEILPDCNISVAKILRIKTGDAYNEYNNDFFLISQKLHGSRISNIKDRSIALEMGKSIARLHTAFIKCQKEVEFLDNSLLEELKE